MFSKTTEYALRATIYIAQNSSVVNKIGIDEIAKAIDSPKSFTAKVLQLLTKDSRVISSVSGPKGGFDRTDEAKNLPVRSVLEATGESIVLEKCVLGLNKCSEKKPCPMHSRYKDIKEQLVNLFTNEPISKLAEETKLGNVFIGNC